MRVWGDTGRYPDLCAGILETTEKIPFEERRGYNDTRGQCASGKIKAKLQLRIVAEMEEACQKNSLKKRKQQETLY